MSEVETTNETANETESETVVVNPVETAQSKFDAAVKALSDAESAFNAMLTSAGADMDTAKRLEVANAFSNATRLHALAESNLKSAQNNAKAKVANDALNPLRDTLRDALNNANAIDAMKAGEVGATVIFTATHGDTGWTINFRFQNAPARAATSTSEKPAASSAGTGGTRARVSVQANGESLSTRDYVFKYFDAAKSAGYATQRASASDVPANEYAKIAPVMAEKLGHEVTRQ